VDSTGPWTSTCLPRPRHRSSARTALPPPDYQTSTYHYQRGPSSHPTLTTTTLITQVACPRCLRTTILPTRRRNPCHGLTPTKRTITTAIAPSRSQDQALHSRPRLHRPNFHMNLPRQLPITLRLPHPRTRLGYGPSTSTTAYSFLPCIIFLCNISRRLLLRLSSHLPTVNNRTFRLSIAACALARSCKPGMAPSVNCPCPWSRPRRIARLRSAN
jgi:hypothetical protein